MHGVTSLLAALYNKHFINKSPCWTNQWPHWGTALYWLQHCHCLFLKWPFYPACKLLCTVVLTTTNIHKNVPVNTSPSSLVYWDDFSFSGHILQGRLKSSCRSLSAMFLLLKFSCVVCLTIFLSLALQLYGWFLHTQVSFPRLF